MTAGHFIFIPAVLLVGIVIGWVLGSRAAADAYAAELRRRELKLKQQERKRQEEVERLQEVKRQKEEDKSLPP